MTDKEKAPNYREADCCLLCVNYTDEILERSRGGCKLHSGFVGVEMICDDYDRKEDE